MILILKDEFNAKSLFQKTKYIFNQGNWDCSGHFYNGSQTLEFLMQYLNYCGTLSWIVWNVFAKLNQWHTLTCIHK